MIGLGSSVGLFICLYYLFWLFASKFADFAFNVRMLNQMFRANVKSLSDTASQKSHISRMSDIKSRVSEDKEGGTLEKRQARLSKGKVKTVTIDER